MFGKGVCVCVWSALAGFAVGGKSMLSCVSISTESNNSHWIDSTFCFRHRINCFITSVCRCRCCCWYVSRIREENEWQHTRESVSYIASNFTLNDFQLMAGEWFSKAMRWRTPSFVARGTFYVCFLSVDPHTHTDLTMTGGMLLGSVYLKYIPTHVHTYEKGHRRRRRMPK